MFRLKKLCRPKGSDKLFQQSLVLCLARMSTKPVHRYLCKARKYRRLKKIIRRGHEIRKGTETFFANAQPIKHQNVSAQNQVIWLLIIQGLDSNIKLFSQLEPRRLEKKYHLLSEKILSQFFSAVFQQGKIFSRFFSKEIRPADAHRSTTKLYRYSS